MYKSFEVRNFRCFRELKITDIERVNLIAGANNIGKTTLLEALFLHCGAYNPGLTLRLDAWRGIPSMKVEFGGWAGTPWDSLFNDLDATKTVELIGENEASARRAVRLRVIRQHEELAKIGQFARHDSEKPESGLPSSESGRVLELEYEEGKNRGKHFLILDAKGVRTLPIAPEPPFPAYFCGDHVPSTAKEDANLFGSMQIRGEKTVLLEALKTIEPRLRELDMVVLGDLPILHGDIGAGRLLPLPLMGGGMGRLAKLVLRMGAQRKGIVLADEIENGLHHSVLPKVWRAVGTIARQSQTQIFATTHSLECVMAAHQAFSDSGPYDFRLHRLEHVADTISVKTYDQETLAAAIEIGFEVR